MKAVLVFVVAVLVSMSGFAQASRSQVGLDELILLPEEIRAPLRFIPELVVLFREGMGMEVILANTSLPARPVQFKAFQNGDWFSVIGLQTDGLKVHTLEAGQRISFRVSLESMPSRLISYPEELPKPFSSMHVGWGFVQLTTTAGRLIILPVIALVIR